MRITPEIIWIMEMTHPWVQIGEHIVRASELTRVASSGDPR
jgi:hypothetical protein